MSFSTYEDIFSDVFNKTIILQYYQYYYFAFLF